MRLTFLLAFALVALAATPCLAEPLSTDRPDLTETSQVVGRGAYQIEQGVQVLTAPAGPLTVFPSLHRLGLNERFELRVETPVVELSGGSAAFTGLALGAKWRMRDGGEPGQWPSASLLAHLDVEPTGRLVPIAKLLSDYALPLGFELSVNAGGSINAGQPDWDLALALGREVFGPVSVYGEVARATPLGASGPGWAVDGGVRYLVSDDLQLDAAVYKGLNGGAPDWFGTVGVSARWGR